MTHDEIVLINLYISLRLAEEKKQCIERNECKVPARLRERIVALKTAIAQHEARVAA